MFDRCWFLVFIFIGCSVWLFVLPWCCGDFSEIFLSLFGFLLSCTTVRWWKTDVSERFSRAHLSLFVTHDEVSLLSSSSWNWPAWNLHPILMKYLFSWQLLFVCFSLGFNRWISHSSIQWSRYQMVNTRNDEISTRSHETSFPSNGRENQSNHRRSIE